MIASVPVNLMSLLVLLTLMGSHADMPTENSEASCPTTVTASTTPGVSLLQSNRRVDASLVREYSRKQGATEGDFSMRNIDLTATGPKGARNLDIAAQPTLYYSSGASIGESSKEIPHIPPTSIRPSTPEPQLYDGLDSSVSSTDVNATAVWGFMRRMEKRWTDGTTFLLESVQQQASFLLSSSETSAARSSRAIILLCIMLAICVGCLCWKVNQASEPGLKFPQSNQPSYNPASVQRLSPVFSNRSPPGASVLLSAGEPRQLGNDRLSNCAGLDGSSDDDINTARAVDGEGFCPDLVVPQQCECILVVPVYAPVGNFNICDMNGRTVLQAFTQIEGQGNFWQLHLQTATGAAPQTLARCIEVRPSNGSSTSVEFRILDAEGKPFATLTQVQVQGQLRFELTTQHGFKLYFYGNFQTQAINVTDEDDSLLATTEPCGVDFDQAGVYYRLRVAPLANVGHSLCALLCIGQILRTKTPLP